MDGGQGRVDPGHDREVVETDDAQVVGDAQARLAGGLVDAECLQVVGGEDRCRAFGQGQQGTRRLAAVLTGEFRMDDEFLLKGRDYTVSGDQLTLTAATLTKLAGDRTYGVDATLEARFSRGVPWRIDVITYDTPVLSDASGSTSGLTIPTRFR